MTAQLPFLGLRSEYVISHLSSEFIDTDDVIVLSSPDDPNYYFGNLLALKIPLDCLSPTQWLQRFQERFQHLPAVKHCTLVWVREEPIPVNVSRFMQLGFDYEENHVLYLKREHFRSPDQLNVEVDYRPLVTDDDWSQWTSLNIAEQIESHTEEELRPYLAGRIRNYHALKQKGLGETLGAFHNGRLIGYAGLYHLNGLGRYQNVHVIPEFQNRHMARTLLTHLTQRLPETVDELVIVADEHYHASKLYQSLGFTIAERECSLCWWPGKTANQNSTT